MAHVRSDAETSALITYVEAGHRLQECKGCPLALEVYRLAALNLRKHTRPGFHPVTRTVIAAGRLAPMPARHLVGAA
jgi:hypothetical protein